MIMILLSCKEDPVEVLTFEDTVEYVETDPRLFLSKLDTLSSGHKLSNENDATLFLLNSMCKNYIDEKVFPPLDNIEKCVSYISVSKDVRKQLESLLFLARAYHNNNDAEKEISTVNKALDIAKKHKDNKWIFYLYTYLSEIYLKNVDLIRFAESQSMAKTYYKEEELKQTDIYTKLAIGKTYIYNHKYDKAIDVFRNISHTIGDRHAYYGYNQFLYGLAYFKNNDWKSCIRHIEIALQKLHRPRILFICYSILTHCYASLGNLDKANFYKKQAISSYTPDKFISMEIEFYKICAELARKSDNISEETLYLNKIIDIYDNKLRTLNDKTLSEALLKYEYNKKVEKYKNKIEFYKYMAFSLVFVLIVSVILYIAKKKQQAYRLLLLNEQIAGMESLKSVSEEAKFMIARDIEIAKRISYLKYSNNEKSEKLIHEIEKLNIVNGNKLLDSQWNEFFRHIDIIFDGFHTRLLQKYHMLTEKEVQLCCMLVAGFRTEEVASVWQQSIYTVHKAKTNIRKKVSSAEGIDLISFLKEKLY